MDEDDEGDGRLRRDTDPGQGREADELVRAKGSGCCRDRRRQGERTHHEHALRDRQIDTESASHEEERHRPDAERNDRQDGNHDKPARGADRIQAVDEPRHD